MAKTRKSRRAPRGQGAERAEARQALKQARREERARLEAAARLQRLLRRLAFWGGLVVVLALGAYFLFRSDELDGVERPTYEGRGHITSPTYDTPTPTSGPHLASTPNCGSYDSPLEPGLAVHALEHGTVLIWYRSDLADELERPLLDLLGRYDSHVIVSPNEEIRDRIIATAWSRLKRYDTPEGLDEFVETYRNRGPEQVECPIEA